MVVSDFDTLLMFAGAAGALTLPSEQVPADALDYLKNRFTAFGKKVEDKRKQANPPPSVAPVDRRD